MKAEELKSIIKKNGDYVLNFEPEVIKCTLLGTSKDYAFPRPFTGEKDKDIFIGVSAPNLVTADMVNAHIAEIKNDYSKDDHYHIYQAFEIYSKLSGAEKAKVDINKLNNSKEKYDEFIDSVRDIL